ncbi:MAG: biotin/lipoyl-containing protein [Carboxydocellales bacterium]
MKKLRVTINGIAYDVQVEELPTEGGTAPASIQRSPESEGVHQVAPTPQVVPAAAPVKSVAGGGSGDIVAPMPGVIKSIVVKAGDKVKAGDVVVVLEAMKMENEISTKKAGKVKEIKVSVGQTVGMGESMVVIS